MKRITLEQYAPIISDKSIGDEIYNIINSELEKSGKVIIDMSAIKSMATFNAKQIFGRLYIELGAGKFFDNVQIINASNDVKIIIRMGIQSALEERQA